MLKLLNTLWCEPRAPNASGPQWQDWLLVVVIMILSGVEVFFREDLVWRPLALGVTMTLMLLLPWRRIRPVQMVFLGFGISAVVQIAVWLLDVEWTALFTTVFLMILPYALLRWASGREAFIGLGFILLTFAITIGIDGIPLSEILAGGLFILFPSALGASARYRNAAEQRAREQVRLREREQLARELHDTVAHHVSAIAIQAQAGRALAATRAEAPLEALQIIEEAASKTLSEMRRIVRTMRNEGQPGLVPAASIVDIERLALDKAYPLTIEVKRSGELNDLDATLASTLFRLTQESITNAVRHADGAKNLTVQLVGNAEQIHLTIQDDGNSVTKQKPAGFGLQGMAERVALLGGTLSAGPGEEHGWIVKATLPRTGAVS